MNEQIKKYLELANKATPGPWRITEDYHILSAPVGKGRLIPYDKPDQDFIAASRTMGPALAKALIRAIERFQNIMETPWSRPDSHLRVEASLALADIEKILND